MLIGIEASALHGCKSGVGYYTENLITSMMQVAPEHDYVLYSNRPMRADWQRVGHEVIYGERYMRMRAAWMQTVLPGTLRRTRPMCAISRTISHQSHSLDRLT